MALPTTEVTGHETSIPGLIFFDVTRVGDDRGYFQEKFHKAKLVAEGLPESFDVIQTSVAYSKAPGVTRGFHAEPWEKYGSVVAGEGFAAFVDLRRGDSFGRVETTMITPESAVFIPRGVGNSFQALAPDTIYVYNVNAHWRADNYDEYCFVNLGDPEVGVEWPISLEEATLSDRDRGHPRLDEIEPMDV